MLIPCMVAPRQADCKESTPSEESRGPKPPPDRLTPNSALLEQIPSIGASRKNPHQYGIELRCSVELRCSIELRCLIDDCQKSGVSQHAISRGILPLIAILAIATEHSPFPVTVLCPDNQQRLDITSANFSRRDQHNLRHNSPQPDQRAKRVGNR
jgi:hypothetical protein